MHRFFTFGILLVCLLLASFSVRAQEGKDPALRIAIAEEFAPFSVIAPDGEPYGLFIDVWKAWSEVTGRDIRFVPAVWRETLDLVKTGAADVHFGLFRNRERDKVLSFSDPFHAGRTKLYFKNPQDKKLGLEDLQGRKVAVISGTYQQQFLQSQHPTISIQPFDTANDLARALLLGDVDATFIESATIDNASAQMGLRGVFHEGTESALSNNIYAAVAKGREDLLPLINTGLKGIPRDHFVEMEMRWLPNMADHYHHQKSMQVQLDEAEKKWLKENPVQRIAVSTFIKPIDILNKDGSYEGLNADLLAMLNKKTGLNLVPQFFSKWPELVKATLGKKVDGALSFSMTPERMKFLEFTSAYAYDSTVVVTREENKDISNWNDLVGKTVAVVSGIAFENELQKLKNVNIRTVSGDRSGLGLVSAGEVDAFVTSLVLMGSSQRENYVPGLKVAASLVEEGGALRIAIDNQKPELYSIIKKGYQALTQDELTALRQKWLSPEISKNPNAVLFNEEERQWLRENPIQRIALLKKWEPYDLTNEEGIHQGLHADLLKLVNKHLGTNFVPWPQDSWPQAYELAQTGEADGILGLSWTRPREDIFFFSTPYHYKAADLVMRKSDPPIHDWKEADGKKIMVRAKASLIEKIKQDLPKARIIEAASEDAALERLSQGEGDAYLAWLSADRTDLTAKNLVISAQIDDRQGEFTLGVSKSKPIVAKIVQKGFNAITQEEWKNLKKKWLSTQQAGELSLNEAERRWLQAHPQIDIATMAKWPPISYLDETGHPTGINAALITTLNKKLNGLLRLRPGEFKDNFQAVKNKEIPALLDVTPTKPREEFFEFTRAYLNIPHVFIAQKTAPFIDGVEALYGRKIALERGFGNVKWFKENHPEIEVVEYENTSRALDSVARGETDAYAGNRAVSLYVIERELLHNLKAHASLNKKTVELAIGVRKDWPILRDILQKALNSLSDEEQRAIFNNAYTSRAPTTDALLRLSRAEEDWLAQRSTIRVMVGDEAPFYFMEEGVPKGVSVDYVTWALKTLGLEPEFISMNRKAGVESIGSASGADILPSVRYSRQREQQFAFSKDYLSFPRVIFSRKNAQVTNLGDLGARKIAVERGSIIQQLLENDHPGTALHIVDDTKAALEAVSFGQADAYVANLAVGTYMIEQFGLTNLGVSGQTPYKSDQLSMGVRKDWPELVTLLNKALAVIPQAEKRAIRQKWFDQTPEKATHVNQIALSDDEREWVRQNPVITVHNELGWAPFSFYEDDQPKGFSVDYVKLLGRKIGVDVKFISGPTWNEFLQMLKARELDVMMNIVQTPERSTYIGFTGPYVTNPPLVVTEYSSDIHSFDDLEGRTVCVPEGYFYQELFENHYPAVKLYLTDEQSDCLKAVSDGRVDATIGGLAVQDYLIKKLFLSNLRFAGGVADERFNNELRIGVHKDNTVLLSLLQRAVDAVSEDEVGPIRNRWITHQNVEAEQSAESVDDFKLLMVVAATIFALIVLFAVVREISRRMSKNDDSKAYESREVKGTGMIVVAVFLAVVVIAAYISAQEAEKRARQNVLHQLETVMTTTHEAIRSWLSNEMTVVQKIAARPLFQHKVKRLITRNTRKINADIWQWFEKNGPSSRYQGYFLLDARGQVLASHHGSWVGKILPVGAEAIGQMIASARGKPKFITPVQYQAPNGQTVQSMFIAVPVRDKQNKVQAVLSVAYDPADDFSRIAHLGRIGDTGETYLINKEGFFVTESRFRNQLEVDGVLKAGQNTILNVQVKDLKTNVMTNMAQQLLAGQDGANVQGYPDYRGIAVLGTWVWDREFDFGLTSEIDDAEAMEIFYSMRKTMFIILGLTIAMALGLTALSVWIGQSANKSLRRARDTLEQEVEDRTRELNFQKFALDKHAIVSATDADGNITYINDLFLEITGYSREELMGCNHRLMKSGRHDRDFYQNMWSTISSGNVWHGEICNRNKDGSRVWLAASIIPFMAQNGEPEQYISIRTDITERKRAERRARENESRIRAIIENAVDGIIVIDVKGVIQSFSPAAEQIFGYREAEVVGHNVKMLMPEDFAVRHDQFLQNYMDGKPAGIVGSNREVVGQRKDRTTFPMDLAIGHSVVGESHIFTGIVRDISSRKEAEKELQDSRNQMHNILSNVQQGVVFFDDEKRLITWNKQYPDIINLDEEFLHPGMSLDDLALVQAARGDYGDELEPIELARQRVDMLWSQESRYDLKFGDGRIFDAHSIRTPDGQLVITYTDITQRKANEEIIAKSMKFIQESISYASRIQRSVLPTLMEMKEAFKDQFLIWEPKDIVGGDICLYRKTPIGDLIVLVDCTGHGVPGAFMTMVVTGALDQALTELPEAMPDVLLARMNQLVKTVLNQNGDEGESDDGFECGMCLIDKANHHLFFAGARFELWALRDNEFEIYKGDKVGIGYCGTAFDRSFSRHQVVLVPGVKFYMSSDGMIDQVGGEKRRGFGKRRLKRTLLENSSLTFTAQHDAILETFAAYQGNEERRDDLSLLGFEVEIDDVHSFHI